MRRKNLIKGSVKYVIMAASAFMLTCTTAAGNGNVMEAYADEAVVGEDGESAGEAEQESEGETDTPEEDDQTDDGTGEEDGAGEEGETGEEDGDREEGGTEGEGDGAGDGEDGEEPSVGEDTLVGGGMETEPDDGDASEEDQAAVEMETGVEEDASEEEEENLEEGIMTMALELEEDSWYLTGAELSEDGYYYIDGEKVTSYFIEITVDEKTKIVYINSDGEMVTGQGQWIEDSRVGWRYITKKGYVVMNENRILDKAGNCYCFDENGEYTLIEGDFFEVEDDNDNLITRYACGDGTVARDTDGNYYYFEDDENGKRFCYITVTSEDGETTEAEVVTSIWIDGDLRVNSNGRVLMDENKIVGGMCYHFDEDGHYSEIKDTFFTQAEDINGEDVEVERLAFEDGSAAGLEDITGVSYYFITNEHGKKFCYRDDTFEVVKGDEGFWLGWVRVNTNGRVLTNENKIIGGQCYVFDAEGFGKYRDPGFFTVLEDDGNDNDIEVIRYATSDNHKAAKDENGFYSFEESGDSYLCYGGDGSTVTETWLDGMWINEDGLVVKNSDCELVEGKYYSFADYESTLITEDLVTDGDNTYYVDEAGDIVKSQFVTYGGNVLYFGEDGTQWKAAWVDDTYYVDENGYKVLDTEKEVDGKLYYFDENGKALYLNGYVTVGDSNYYYENNAKVTEEFRAIDGGTAYFGADGAQQMTGWVQDTYYIGENGVILVSADCTFIDDVAYSFDADGRKALVNGYMM